MMLQGNHRIRDLDLLADTPIDFCTDGLKDITNRFKRGSRRWRLQRCLRRGHERQSLLSSKPRLTANAP